MAVICAVSGMLLLLLLLLPMHEHQLSRIPFGLQIRATVNKIYFPMQKNCESGWESRLPCKMLLSL